eukprot:1653095-Prymnesium_polylepis.1
MMRAATPSFFGMPSAPSTPSVSYSTSSYEWPRSPPRAPPPRNTSSYGGSSHGCFTGSACYRVSSNPTGPRMADGTPDIAL